MLERYKPAKVRAHTRCVQISAGIENLCVTSLETALYNNCTAFSEILPIRILLPQTANKILLAELEDSQF